MRHTFVLLVLLGTCFPGLSQENTAEHKAIEAQVNAFFTSWNNHDFSDMKNYIAEDCDFVNIAGFHWKGGKDVQYAHQTVHQTIFKDVPLEKRAVTIRFLTSDVAVAHVLMHPMKSYTTPDGSKGGDSDALATFVFVKKRDAWMVEAVENVVVSEVAKPFNPVPVKENSRNN